jgi:hypothetical protein
MMQALGVAGVVEHIPIALGLIVVGWLVIRWLAQMWDSWKKATVALITSAIDLHVKEHHTSDEAWRTEMREEWRHFRQDIKDVHKRIDDLYKGPRE